MRSSTGLVDRAAILAAYDEWEAAQEKIAALPIDALTPADLVDLLARRERVVRKQGTEDDALLARLDAEVAPRDLGASSLRELLSTRLRISRAEALRRIANAHELGPRRSMAGEPLAPRWAVTAAAQARGDVGPEHVQVIGGFFKKLPGWVDATTREQAEQTLGSIAARLGPEELRQAAAQLLALLDQDGELDDDAERARKRSLTIGRQQPDGMTPISGLLDPQARAALDAVLASWAAPGMCNPDQQSPCVDGTPDAAAAERDTRTTGQRNHDALAAVLRAMLASEQLGQHNGLPATIIVSTTLTELESGVGHAVTGGGTLLPMRDVIRLASHAHHYLVIFKDNHQRVPLYLGRTRRLASPGQRIVLHSIDRGCSHPGCTAPGYQCQAHHAVLDWAKGGHTNIDDLTLACAVHNRLVTHGGWITRKRRDGRTEWIPPPMMDAGQARVNDYHDPQRYLTDLRDT